MKIIAIDSSGLTASVAILEEEQILAEYSVNYKKTHSQTLVPMLNELKQMIELDLNTIDAIAIAKGPGSFTGLRIGSATAKGLGLALDKPIIPVGTLEGLAMNAWNYGGLICPIMDARRNQVYTGIYKFEEGKLVTLLDQCPMDIEEICKAVSSMINESKQEPILFLGDGVPVYRDRINEIMTVPFTYAPAHMNRQRASALGVLAFEYYKQGITESASAHKPEYLRKSQAEREREESVSHSSNDN